MDMEKMYAAMEKQEKAKQKAAAEAKKDFDNPNMISMQSGNTYEVRLMYWASGIPGERSVPIIEKTVHAAKNSDGRYVEITCPVSDYLMGRSGYNACPVCSELSKLWEAKKKGSASASSAYDKFKRKFKGYVVVYVVNDPTKPENNGTFKIMYVNAIVKEYLDTKIKGIDRKGVAIANARKIGFKAYDITENGKNLFISITNDGKHNKYSCEFDDGDALPIDMEQIEQAYEDLEFEKFYTQFDPKATQAFYEEIVLEKETVEAEPEAVAAEPEDDIPMDFEEKAEETVEEKAEAPAEKPKAKKEKPASKKEATASSSDIDDILADLPS